MIYPVKIIDILNDEDVEGFDVVQKYEAVDGMYGLSHVKITDADIRALTEGKCLYYTDGEYAYVISYESEDKNEANN
jgi:hypothetical protein